MGLDEGAQQAYNEEQAAAFIKEDEATRADRVYRESHDATGHYFNQPNRAQRRHIKASWKNKPIRRRR